MTTVINVFIFASFLIMVFLFFRGKQIKDRDEQKIFLERWVLWIFITSIVGLVAHNLCYNVTRLFTENVKHHNFGTALDAALPLLSFFVVFYLFAYVVIIFCPYYIAMVGGKKGGKQLLQKYLLSVIILLVICSLFYLFLPNDVPHAWTPDVYGKHTGFFDRILEFVYDNDQASNGLPSLHNSYIWLVFFLIIFNVEKGRRLKFALPAFIAGVFISLSTLFCKEHYLVDVAFSIPLVALITFFTKRFFKSA